ncbi:MAG: hypothetical protein H7833_18470 [Magnetococcus sp. DMHC-1]
MVGILCEGLRQIHKQKRDFGRGVAAWRLHLRLKRVLRKSRLPPPDYVPARLADDPEQLAERLWDQDRARHRQDWLRVAQIKREFANIAAFEARYGAVIDRFKRQQARAKRKTNDLD